MRRIGESLLSSLRGLFAPGQSGRKGVLIILIFTLVSKSMGFLREVLMAYFFGAGPAVDAFVAAYTVYTLAVLLPSSLLPVVGTPILVEQGIKGGREKQKEVFASLFSLWLVASFGLMILLAITGPWLVRVVAPLLPKETHSLAVRLFYVLLPMTLGMVFVHLAVAYYNARRSFAIPQTSGIIMNAVIIPLMFAGPGLGIYALGAGWSLGYLVASVILILPVVVGSRVIGRVWTPQTKEFFVLSIPLLLGYGLDQINTTIGRIFASSLPSGSISYLYYGWRVFDIPMLLITALTTVHLTKAAEMASVGNIKELRAFTFSLIGKALLVIGPLSLLMFILAGPIVKLVFQRGAFEAEAASATTITFRCFVLSMFPLFVSYVALATFRGMKEFRIPLIISVSGILFSILGNVILIKPFGVGGLAASATITIYLNAAIMLFLMWKRIR